MQSNNGCMTSNCRICVNGKINKCYYLTKGMCSACGNNCKSCFSITNCTDCNPGYGKENTTLGNRWFDNKTMVA